MNSLRSILVHVDSSSASEERVRVARTLAAEQGASVTALYAATPSVLQVPMGMEAGGAAISVLQELDAERLRSARERFKQALGDAPASVHWAELGAEPVIPGFIREAWWSDLVVLGQHPRGHAIAEDVPFDFVPSVVIGSGRPALVVPQAGRFETVGRRVLVAWKATRESARALSAAWPLLERAEQVHIALWREPNEQDADTRALERHCQSHGVTPTVHARVADAAGLGDAILSFASELGADLLVMGCYGHSRVREFVLGGASRAVLDEMTLPVLMAH